MSNRRGQMISMDMIIALAMFIFIMLGSFWAWHMTEYKINYIKDMTEMEVMAKNSLNSVVGSSGEPSNWHITGNITSIGIMKDMYGVASEGKIDKLIGIGNSSYDNVKHLLGIVGGYEVYLDIGGRTTGMVNNASIENVVVVDRAMLLENGTRASVSMRVWKI